MKRGTVLLVAMAACADNDFVVRPYIDFPANEAATPYPVDQLTISVAHAGSEIDLVSATFPQGSNISLSDIPFGDDLVMHMTGRYKGSDVAYGRTCQFELRADARVPVPHLWLSKTVKWGSLSTQPIARSDGVAITFSDGSGLVLGGHTPELPSEGIRQVERFDPSTGEYELLHDILPRVGQAVALLGDIADTRVVVIGGVDADTGLGAQFVEVLDADRTTEHQYDMFPDTQMPLVGISATSLTDGRVIAIGGREPPSGAFKQEVIEISVEGGTPIIAPLRAKLAFPRFLHTATRLGDQVGSPVLITGGLDAAGKPVAQAELFKPLAENFESSFTPAMKKPRWHHQAVRLPDGSVLIIGGVDELGTPIREIELFSLDTGFRLLPDPSNPTLFAKLPDSAGVVDFSATTLPDGRVLIAGGRSFIDGPALNTAFIASLDPFDGTVDIVPTDRLPSDDRGTAVARAGHQATSLCDGTVLIAGGTASQTAFVRYNPPPVSRR
ncbi:MAG TPA: kelch repeat-containing protein [Kofleriaceae bacterium]|nr:kelch repeat-containing protein [Kofleriaceae bacterium]